MKSIADVNVLFPLLCGGHAAQAPAQAWFDQQTLHSVGWCLLTRLALLRLLTNPRVMGSDVQSSSSALSAWDALEQDERLVELPPPPLTHEETFRRLVAGRKAAPNLWTDAWLAALSEALALEMVTFDRDFKRFSLTRLRLLEIP